MKFKYHRWFQWLVVPFVALAFHIYFGYRIIGRENIPEGGCVVCPNHIQLSDPPFAAVALSHRTPLRLMAKKELFQGNKLFAWLIAALGAFPVDREGADITAIKTALSSVKAGQKLIIFPQGTRGAAEGETKKGAAMLAVKSRAPILPMYITEGKGFRCRATVVIGEAFTLDYDLPNDTVYAETCASIALIFAARALLQAERDGRYGDVMERALYNTCLAGMNVTQDAFFYVNPLSVVPESSHEDPTKKHVLPVRPGWFGCSCCPPNLARLLGSLGQYVCGTAGNEVRVHLYVDGEMQLETDKGPVKLTVHTDYPRTGEISISVSGECDLALRLPDWCHGSFELTMDKGEYAPKVEKGYLLMPGLHGETQILLTLPMKLRRVYAHSAVRADAGKVAIMRGPVVFCAEEADNGKNLHLLALPRSAELTAVWDGQLLGGAWRIKANALRQQEDGGDAPLYTDEAPKLHAAQLSLIPYHLWANRGEGEMEVWIRETLQGC